MRRPLFAVFLLLPALTWAENFFELVERSSDSELIIEAARALTAETVQAGLDAAADLEARDDWGYTPLMWAAWKSENPEVVQALLDAGADVKAKSYYDGETAWDLIYENEALQGTNVYQR